MAYGLGMAKGFLVTLKNFFRPPVTVQYPEERAPQHPRFRGENFVWYEERCTGCAACARYCPLGIIKIVTEPSGQMVQEGEKYRLVEFTIELRRCMFCGLCVEACPYDALHMGSGFEFARYEFDRVSLTIDDLRRMPKRPSTWFRPQLEAKGYDPFTGPVLSWEEVGREEAVRPTEEQMRQRYVEERMAR